MHPITLRQPTLNDKNMVLDYKEEFLRHGDSMDGTSGLVNKESYEEWLDELIKNSNKSTVLEGFVPATTYLAIRENDQQLVGMINIRHELNDYLLNLGGHIGYSVRKSERRKGYAGQMLSMALDICQTLYINRILITCDKNNIGSAKTIIKNGGQLENEVTEAHRITQRYWIDLPKFTFTREQFDKIQNHYGDEFINRVKTSIPSLTDKWLIKKLSLIEFYSSNLVFKGESDTYGPVILKFARNGHEYMNEIQALEHFNQAIVCKLHAKDDDRQAFLIERLIPGNTLFEEKDMLRRVTSFCNLFKNLHLENKITPQIDEENMEHFQSYKGWILRITDYMSRLPEWTEVHAHMLRAKELFLSLSESYPADRLIHGDFHYYNILKDQETYKIIDPKGVIEHPVFDLPRYIINEYWDTTEKSKAIDNVVWVVSIMSKELTYPKEVLYTLLYIEATMGTCWCVESGLSSDEKDKTLKSLEDLYRLIQIKN